MGLAKTQHPVTDLTQQRLLMAEDQYAEPALLTLFHQLLPEVALKLRIQLGGHLVGDEQPGFLGSRARNSAMRASSPPES